MTTFDSEEHADGQPAKTATTAGDDAVSELTATLKILAAQIENAENVHTDALQHLQDSLQAMSREARLLRAKLPADDAPKIDGILDHLAALSARVGAVRAKRAVAAAAGNSAPELQAEHVNEPANEAEGIAMEASEPTVHAAQTAQQPQQVQQPNQVPEQAPQVPTPADYFDTAADMFAGSHDSALASVAAELAQDHPKPEDEARSSILEPEGAPAVDADDPWDRESAEALTRTLEEDSGSGPVVIASTVPTAKPVEEASPPTQPGPAAPIDENAAIDRAFAAFDNELSAIASPSQENADGHDAEATAQVGAAALDAFEQHAMPENTPVEPTHEPEPQLAAADHFSVSHAAPDADAPLEVRLAEIAVRLEEQLCGTNPESSLTGRISQLEKRFDKAMASVATQADVEGLAAVESQLEQLSHAFEKATDRFSKLDAIEMNVDAIRSQLAGDGMTDIGDMQGIAGQAGLNELIQTLISDQREGGEHTVAMLDTLQQAMMRVLDRMDQLEGTNPDAGSGAFSTLTSIPQDDVARQVAEPAQVPGAVVPPPMPQPEAVAAMQAHFDAQQQPAEAPAVNTPAPPAQTVDIEPERPTPALAPLPTGDRPSLDQIRQNLVADARRAKARSAAEANEGGRKWPGANLLGALSRKKKAEPTPAPATVAAAPAPDGEAEQKSSWFSFTMPFGRVAAGALLMVAAVQCAALLLPYAHSEGWLNTSVTGVQPANESVDGKSNPTLNRTSADAKSVSNNAVYQPSNATVSGPDARLFEAAGKGPLPLETSRFEGSANTVAPKPTPAALHDKNARLSKQEEEKSRRAASHKAHKGLQLPPATVGPLSLRLAAAKGDPSAEFEVGARLAEGRGTKQDYKSAAKWYKRAAAKGFAQAQYRMATLYERGLGVSKDPSRARVWYRRAAEKGNVKAMHNLAVLSAGNNKNGPDYATAAQWFTQAASYGLPDSQYNLAVLHANGLGVTKDLREAYKYYSLAARSGDKEATRRRDELRSALKIEDLAEAEDLLRSFQAKRPGKIANDARAAGRKWSSR